MEAMVLAVGESSAAEASHALAAIAHTATPATALKMCFMACLPELRADCSPQFLSAVAYLSRDWGSETAPQSTSEMTHTPWSVAGRAQSLWSLDGSRATLPWPSLSHKEY